MAFNLRNRDLLSLVHHSERDLLYLIDLARDLKRAKYSGAIRRSLEGKNIALIFEKTSTRTRCAFEVAAHDEGAHVTYIDPTSSQIGHKESRGTPLASWAGCTTRSSIEGPVRKSSRSWPSMPVSPCSTV